MKAIVRAAAGAALLLPAATVAEPATHSVRVEHAGGEVAAHYRGEVAISYRQVGAAGAPGRPSSLRCRWDADLRVAREARTASGATLSRAVGRDAVLSGQRPGWCGTGRAAVAREVAGRRDEVDRHLRAIAVEDGPRLRAELDRVASIATG